MKILKPGARTKDEALWMKIDKLLTLGRTLRRPYEAKWILDLAFLANKQWSFFNSSSHTLHQLVSDPRRIRRTDNKLTPRWLRQVADLVSTSPSMSVVPNSNSEEDKTSAKIGDKVIKSFWQSAEMRKKIRLIAGWLFGTGNCFAEDAWEKAAGPVEITPEGKLVYMGEACCKVWTPFEVYVPIVSPSMIEVNDFPWIITRRWKTLDELVLMFGKKAGKVTAESVMDKGPSLELLLSGTNNSYMNIVEGAHLIHLRLKPCVEYPKGLSVYACNSVILEVMDYPHLTYPLEHFKCIDIPGSFYGSCQVDMSLGNQMTWNNTISSVEEYNKYMARGKMLVPRGSNLEAMPDDTHGELMEYTPVMGYKPEVMQLKGLPDTYRMTLEIASAGLEDMFSQHEVSRGTNKSDIRSGEMVSLLREQDMQNSIPTHVLFEEALERLAQRIIVRIKDNYTEARILSLVNDDDEREVFTFKGADLRNNTTISVKRQSSLPDSRIAREGRVFERYQSGLYGDPADPAVRRVVLKQMDEAVTKEAFADQMKDESLADWENQLLLAEVTLPVNAYDDHMKHMMVHTDMQKSKIYQQVKIKDPKQFAKIEQAFMAHNLQHKAFIEQMMDVNPQ